MNGDDSLTKLEAGEYFNAFNMRGGTSERGHVSGLQAIPGSTLLYNTLPVGSNHCIGACEDEGNSRFLWANWNVNGNHGIYCYDELANQAYPVLLNNQVTGGFGWTQFTYIHSCFIVNKNFYWTDNVAPRRFNIDAGIQLNFTVAAPVDGYIPNIALIPYAVLDPGNAPFGPGFTPFSFIVPVNPMPSYASGQLTVNLYMTGHDGTERGPVALPLNWTNFPTRSAEQIIVDAFYAYINTIPGSAGLAQAVAYTGMVTLYINNGWNFGTGDAGWAPTATANLGLNNYLNADESIPNPYTLPVSQAVISWIRRPPALPPFQQKILENPVPSSNFIGDQAFQFCWRLQSRDKELCTLSPLSDTADFNEQDPPPTETDLVPTPEMNTSLPTRGYLATNYLLPAAPTPAYGPGVYAKITRVGSGSGPNAGAIDIPIPLNWVGYPSPRSYSRVIVEGLATYFAALPGSDNDGALTAGNLPQSIGNTNSKWYISARDGVHPTLNIKETWDWGMGDSTFPPTTSANLTLYTQTVASSRQYSYVAVTLPVAESIDQDIIQVDLVAAFLVSGVYFIIKSWKTAIFSDLQAILNHNSGTTPLSYAFYNNQVGIALDSAYSVKQADAVPVTAETCERAKNCGFLGGVVLGYDSADLPTSLIITQTISVVGTPIGANIQGEWFAIQYPTFPNGDLRPPVVITSYYARTTTPASGQPIGSPYYYYTVFNAAIPLPIDISSGLIYIGTTLNAVLAFYGGTIILSNVDQNLSVAILLEVPSADFGVVAKAFKANAFYQVSKTFYDNYQRRTGIVTDSTLQITTPNTGFSNNQYVTALNWFLNNQNALAEIPEEACYFSVGITKCLRTRFFVEAIGFVSYCTIDGSGALAFVTYAYDPSLHGVAIDISLLVSNGMGYTFSAGDICDFFLNGVYYSLGIIGESGNYLIMSLANVGTVGSSALAQYEIYTPYKRQSNEPSFEQGQLIPISNPGTANRAYSITQGTLAGDVFIFNRSNNGIQYFAEAMSPNNKYYLQWITNAGRPNFTDLIGQVKKTQSICYSNPFIQGSNVNGLSTFDALGTVDLSLEFGDLQKLFLTSKIQKQGTVMLAICVRETVSLYLGEIQVAAPQGDAFLATTSGLIGTIYPLKGSLGTINPESVVGFRGDAYWIDVNNGGPVQYSDNGLELIAKYKMRTFWRSFCAAYKLLTPAQIAAFGSQPGIIGGVDSFNEEILWTIPQVRATPPAGLLPGYTTGAPPNLFNAFDGMAKTMVYKRETNRWMPACSYAAEGFISSGNLLYAFKAGAAWRMNDTTAPANTFFGVAYAAMVMFAPNQFPKVPKQYLAMNVESDVQPTSMIVYTVYPNEQITDVTAEDWNNREGIYYATLRRDRLSPKFTDFNQALNYGDKIISKSPMIQLNFGVDIPAGTITPFYFQLKYVNILFQVSKGHHTQ